ncbi:MAG: metallophosphoesterase family protein [Pirellulaceae bacterium]
MSLLILSDIHANWPALEAVLHAEPTSDAVVFCGDAVDYGPQPAECLLLGHTHLQGIRMCGDVTVVNPGSVGLARDHPGQACYALYTGGQVQLKRIRYDVDRTLAALRASPLPTQIVQGLAAVLGATTV